MLKSFKEVMKESNQGNGDCFVVAAQVALHKDPPIDGTRLKDWTVVHALVYGQGPLSNRRFAHAWNEYKGMLVIDNSNGNEIQMIKQQYYDMGRIDPNDSRVYRKYSVEEALKWMKKVKHYGPWELDESLEESLDKMGKKRIRIKNL